MSGDDRIELVGVSEIHEWLVRITREGVREITYRNDFPAPLAELASGDVWDRDEVSRWLAAHPEALAGIWT